MIALRSSRSGSRKASESPSMLHGYHGTSGREKAERFISGLSLGLFDKKQLKERIRSYGEFL